VRGSARSPCWLGGLAKFLRYPSQSGWFCSKNESVPTDGAKLLEQFPTPAAQEPENKENVRHKSLPGATGGG
jgi:hypothetical protein